MSVRTQMNRSRKPGVSSSKKPARFERRHHHKQVRRMTNAALSQMTELDELTLPRPHHTSIDIDPADRVGEAKAGPARFKVWKTKAWKRRSAERLRRAQIYSNGLLEA